jgi:hypothetical protein
VDTVREVRAERDALAAAPVLQTAAPLATSADAATIDLQITSRDAANRVRTVSVKAGDGRAWTLGIMGRDGGDNISRIRLTPVVLAVQDGQS